MAPAVSAVTGGPAGQPASAGSAWPGSLRARAALGLRYPNRYFGLPLLMVGLGRRVADIGLETRAEGVPALLLPAVPAQALLRSPFQESGIRAHEAAVVPGVEERRIPACGQGAC